MNGMDMRDRIGAKKPANTDATKRRRKRCLSNNTIEMKRSVKNSNAKTMSASATKRRRKRRLSNNTIEMKRSVKNSNAKTMSTSATKRRRE